MVAGIIVTAAADELVLSHPASAANASIGWMILGGAALFLAGHAAFKLTVWRVISWTRLAALLSLACLGLLGPHLSAVALGSMVAAVIIAVAISDRHVMGWLSLLPVMRLK